MILTRCYSLILWVFVLWGQFRNKPLESGGSAASEWSGLGGRYSSFHKCDENLIVVREVDSLISKLTWELPVYSICFLPKGFYQGPCFSLGYYLLTKKKLSNPET